MFEMTEAIQEAINKNLPLEVGNLLKERLEQAELDADAIKTLQDKNTKQSAQLQEYIDRINKLNAEADKHKDLDEREKTISLREEVIKLREGHASERVFAMNNLVERVFANSKLKYHEHIDKTMVTVDGNGYTQQHVVPTDRTIEQES